MQPAAPSGGVLFAPQPALSVVDAAGNLVAVSGASVTANLTSGPAGFNASWLLGTKTATFVNGVAVFHDLMINRYGNRGCLSMRCIAVPRSDVAAFVLPCRFCSAGSTYVITFNTTVNVSSPVVTSASFTVAVGPTTQLVVAVQPNGTLGGSNFTVQPVVSLLVRALPSPCVSP